MEYGWIYRNNITYFTGRNFWFYIHQVGNEVEYIYIDYMD